MHTFSSCVKLKNFCWSLRKQVLSVTGSIFLLLQSAMQTIAIAFLTPSPSTLCVHFSSFHTRVLLPRHCWSNFKAAVHLLLETLLTSIRFFGQELQFSQSVTHLWHILSHDLSNKDDFLSVRKDLWRRSTVCSVSCDPYTKSKLLQRFYLILYIYGASPWMASSADLYSLEVSLNNILRKFDLCSMLSHWDLATSR